MLGPRGVPLGARPHRRRDGLDLAGVHPAISRGAAAHRAAGGARVDGEKKIEELLFVSNGFIASFVSKK
eukprot:5497475-Pyramimonas_sp.AAC.1